MDSRPKVFITSLEPGVGTKERILKNLYELSDKRYDLTGDPDQADIILIGCPWEENWGKTILKNRLIDKYPDKSFSISDADIPLYLHHGIYASGRNVIHNFHRIRSGSYTLYTEEFRNPFITNYYLAEGSVPEKKFLFSFIGRNASDVRNEIFQMRFTRPDILVEDSSNFDLWSNNPGEDRSQRQKYYFDILIKSKFSLCPRGTGVSSLRLFESMMLGIAPVIIADQYIFPRGPDWNGFAIIVKEKDIRNLEEIIQSHENDYVQMGKIARKTYEDYFSDQSYFNYVVSNCLEIQHEQRIPEFFFWWSRYMILGLLYLIDKVKIRSRLKKLIPANG